MLTTIDLPVVSHVKQASIRKPFLGLLLTLDARHILQLASEMDLPQPSRERAYRPVSIQNLDEALIDALIRLVELLGEPVLIPRLSPLIQQEITIRLLTSRYGPQLLELVAVGSPGQQIAKAVAWLKQNFTQSLHVDELAARTYMSPSTFRQHFRTITGMSPLQYQKQLRLQEARQLMLNQNLDAGNASGIVGYESASQFSREYRRLFGAPPQRDVRLMRLSQVFFKTIELPARHSCTEGDGGQGRNRTTDTRIFSGRHSCPRHLQAQDPAEFIRGPLVGANAQVFQRVPRTATEPRPRAFGLASSTRL